MIDRATVYLRGGVDAWLAGDDECAVGLVNDAREAQARVRVVDWVQPAEPSQE